MTSLAPSNTRRPLGNLSNHHRKSTQNILNGKNQQRQNVQKAAPIKQTLYYPSSSKEEFVEIEEVRRSREKDEYGNPKFTSLHRYLRGKMLGKGGFAKVYFSRSIETKKEYAIKIVAKANLTKSRARAKLQAEIRIHRTLKHENICEFKHFFEDGLNCYILLELCHNQSMNELLKRRTRLTEPEVLYFMKQIVRGTKYMHGINVIHRDLKLGNLFLDANMNVKIGDLGLAAKLKHADERRKTICGTPNYIAPEIIDGNNKLVGHSFEVDLWSIGVIMFALLCGRPPFESKDVKSTYKRILDILYAYPDSVSVSNNAKHVIDSLLKKEPEGRMPLDEILLQTAFDDRYTFIPTSLSHDILIREPVWGNENVITPAPQPTEYNPAKLLPSFSTKSNPQVKSLSRTSSNNQDLIHANHQGKLLEKKLSELDARDNEPNEQRGITNQRRFDIYSGESDKENGGREERENNPSRTSFSVREKRYACSSSSLARTSSSSTVQTRQTSNDVFELTYQTKKLSLNDKKERDFERRDSAVSSASRSSIIKEKANSSTKRQSFTSTLLEKSTATKTLIPTTLYTERNDPATQKVRSSTNKDIELDYLETMHSRLVRAERIQAGESIKVMSPQPKANEGCAKKWVKRYVDYTSKYGLGFMLNDGSTGVCFNDSTKAVLSSVNENFSYVERRRSRQEEVIPEHYTLSNYPASLEKKVLLLKHFRNYLTEQEKSSHSSSECTDARDEESMSQYRDCYEERETIERQDELVYVKKWFRTRHAILFRLSDRTVQVVFFDQTEIILSAGARLVTFVDKKSERTTFSLNNLSAQVNSEVAKRLRYAKDTMHRLITGQTPDVAC